MNKPATIPKNGCQNPIWPPISDKKSKIYVADLVFVVLKGSRASAISNSIFSLIKSGSYSAKYSISVYLDFEYFNFSNLFFDSHSSKKSGS